MMEDSCEDCMKWEEEFYWTHFQTLHFSQLLLPGFHNRLVIPQKFSTHFKRKLPQTVTLKSPSRITYKVRIEEDEEKTLAFGFGWEKFVKDHSLEENDLLVFKFHGVSDFEVLVFDGQSLCEKPTSYFLRRCGHVDNTKGTISTATSSRSPKRLEDLIDVDIDTMLTSPLVASPTDCEQKEHSNSAIGTSSGQLPTISPTSTGLVSEGKYPISEFKRMRGAISNDTKADVEVISVVKNRKVLFQAERAISPNGFLVVMKRSHVLTKYFLTIPHKWCLKNMLFARQEIVMQVDQKNWEMQFNYYGARGFGGISTGWRKFVHDNNLHEGDVCVFEPANSESEPKVLHLNVYIFRVTEVESSNNG